MSNYLTINITKYLIKPINEEYDEMKDYILNLIKYKDYFNSNYENEFYPDNVYIPKYNNIHLYRYVENERVAYGSLVFEYVPYNAFIYLEMMKNLYNWKKSYIDKIDSIHKYYDKPNNEWILKNFLPILKKIRIKNDKEYNNKIYLQNISKILLIANLVVNNK